MIAGVPPVAGGSAAANRVELEAPLGVATRDGFVYVADYHAGRVWKLSESGEPLASWDGARDGEALLHPSGVAVDARGRVYVADFGAHAVHVFSPDGARLARWGTRGAKPGEFRGPFALAVDGANAVYVTDLDNHRIQKFTDQGAFVATWGRRGIAPGELVDPMGITVDARGEVWVADHGNDRLQRFSAAGEPLGAWGAPSAANADLLGPVGVAAADDGVYVTDLATAGVRRFDRDGALVARWSGEVGAGTRPGDLLGVAASGGLLVLADPAQRRLVRLADAGARAALARRPTSFAVGAAWPNPSPGGATVVFAIPDRARFHADIFDVNGRHVQRLADGVFDPGEHRFAWDGRSAAGAPAPAGVYFVKGFLEGAARTVQSRVAIVR